MKTIYFVRHGEAENNVKTGEIYKAEDSELTPLGFEQANMLAERAARLPIDVLITSPFMRTKQTASIISEKIGMPIEFSELFGERKTPSELKNSRWDDDSMMKVHESWEKTFASRTEQVGDGENFTTIVERAGKALIYLESRPESNILIVSHGFILRVLVAKMLFDANLTPRIFTEFIWGVRTKNTGITVLHFNPEDTYRSWWMSVWNDHAHLG